MPMMATNCKVFSHSETKFKLGWQEDSEESNKKENQNLYHCFYIIQLNSSTFWGVVLEK